MRGADGVTVVEMAGLGRSESAKLPEELGDLAVALTADAPPVPDADPEAAPVTEPVEQDVPEAVKQAVPEADSEADPEDVPEPAEEPAEDPAPSGEADK